MIVDRHEAAQWIAIRELANKRNILAIKACCTASHPMLSMTDYLRLLEMVKLRVEELLANPAFIKCSDEDLYKFIWGLDNEPKPW